MNDEDFNYDNVETTEFSEEEGADFQKKVQKSAKKRSFSKYAVRIVAVLFILFIMMWLYTEYEGWRIRKNLDQYVEDIKQAQEQDYQIAMSDTYGGETPQETLEMFIEAVEAGDYELASEYFIETRKEQELKTLNNSNKNDISNVIEILKKIESVKIEGKTLQSLYSEYEELKEMDDNFSKNRDEFVKDYFQENTTRAWGETKINGFNFSVSFKQYPNGIWKLIEF